MGYKILTKNDILRAMRVTKSNMAAAKYLNVGYQLYKKHAKMYFDNETKKSLFEMHYNQKGVGIPKFFGNKKDDADINKILSGEIMLKDYPVEKFKQRLIHNQILPEECKRCGFKEYRILDYKVPTILNFIDGNKQNWLRENLELLCYNCYFLNVGDIFTKKQIKFTEEYIPNETHENIWDVDMDENMKDHFISLGLIKEDENEVKVGEEFRAYKKY